MYASFNNAYVVSSPPSKLNVVGLGGAVSIRIISVVDWRRKLSTISFAKGATCRKKYSVSVSLSLCVFGVKHVHIDSVLEISQYSNRRHHWVSK